MAQSFADIKKRTRRAVHAAFGVSAFYSDSSLVEPKLISARWHNVKDRFGDAEDDGLGYATTLENVNRVVLNKENLAAQGVSPRRLGTITIPEFNVTLVLQAREMDDGPIEEAWQVSMQ